MMPLGVIASGNNLSIDGYAIAIYRIDDEILKIIGLRSSDFERFGFRSWQLVFSERRFKQGMFSKDGDVVINCHYEDFRDVYAMLQTERPCYMRMEAGSDQSETSFSIDTCVLFTGEEPPGEGLFDLSP